MVIEISISRELAADHPSFIAGCAERGHRVEVFGDSHERPAVRERVTGTTCPMRATSVSPAGARELRQPDRAGYVKYRGGDPLV